MLQLRNLVIRRAFATVTATETLPTHARVQK